MLHIFIRDIQVKFWHLQENLMLKPHRKRNQFNVNYTKFSNFGAYSINNYKIPQFYVMIA